VQADGHEIVTVEGLGSPSELSPVQEGFHEEHGLQCGYCTPGILMSATYLLRNNPNPAEEEIRRAIRGNLCRCTGYVNIVESIRAAGAVAAEEASR
jgi:aerobic carbon-monoxide dehydrogenase small subunit